MLEGLHNLGSDHVFFAGPWGKSVSFVYRWWPVLRKSKQQNQGQSVFVIGFIRLKESEYMFYYFLIFSSHPQLGPCIDTQGVFVGASEVQTRQTLLTYTCYTCVWPNQLLYTLMKVFVYPWRLPLDQRMVFEGKPNSTQSFPRNQKGAAQIRIQVHQCGCGGFLWVYTDFL